MMVLLFIIALAVLILAHEFGHFISAKLSGTKVEEFGLGFPPRIFGVKKGETIYSINWIPFGGFVKILGENGNDKKPGSFASRPAHVRAVILAAGVFFNMALAFLLLSFVYMVGAPASVEDGVSGAQVTIVGSREGSPARGAGFLAGDRIRRLTSAGEILEVKTIADVQAFVARHKGQAVEVEYLRGKESRTASAVPDPVLGIMMDSIGIVSYPPHRAVWNGLKDTAFLTVAILKMFGALIADIFNGGVLIGQVRGPIGIIGMVGAAAEFGFVYVLQFVAMLSINLAILNLMPFPALDGGRLFFLAIESIKRSPINQRFVNYANTVGFAVLILLMLLVTYKDIARIFAG